MTDKIKNLTGNVSNSVIARISFIYWRYLVVDRFMKIKDPKAKNMEILGILSLLIGFTQFLMGLVAIIGNSLIGKLLLFILIIEFISGFLFIFCKCKSVIYSIIVNFPGLKFLIIMKKIIQARFPGAYLLIKNKLFESFKTP